MKVSTPTTLLFSVFSTTTSAFLVDFYTARGCGLFIQTIDLPAESGCSSLSLAGGSTALSARAPSGIPNDCSIEIYADQSCTRLEAFFDFGNDNGEECDDFNAPGPVAFQTFCGLGNSRRKARGALAPALV